MPDAVENALHEAVEAPLGSQKSRRTSAALKIYTLTHHDEGFSKQSVLVNPHIIPSGTAEDRAFLITSADDATALSSQAAAQHRSSRSSHTAASQFVFTFEEVPQDILSSFPSLEISILKPIAAALKFSNRSKVTIVEVNREKYLASHVEINFKDGYLTRADMWKLLTTDLVGTSIYRGEKALFLSSVRASINAIYTHGHRVSSALLDASTKAVFRSDSSRYYILLQMSREMWDFDTDGGGEMMFDKVINGFLPELFDRWRELGTTHSVSVAMFTRMEYDDNPEGPHHQDYYRILTTELESSDSSTIIEELKKEFKIFLRDVSISQTQFEADNATSESRGASDTKSICGRPTNAIHGNILEAIQTASVQFLRANASCDLRRTGLSIIVLTPGVGVFEVNPSALEQTTEMLNENGIYIDLVCFSKMPLHPSPLFRYKIGDSSKTPDHSNEQLGHAGSDVWQHVIPHWIDVSFWQGGAGSDADSTSLQLGKKYPGMKAFVPRVRMYEIQMTGLMQNELHISIEHLECSHTVRFPSSFGVNFKKSRRNAELAPGDLEGSKALYNQEPQELGASTTPDKSPSNSHALPFANLLQWMDDYDERTFNPPTKRAVSGRASTRPIESLATRAKHTGKVLDARKPSVISLRQKQSPVSATKRKTSSASIASKSQGSTAKYNSLPRQFGPGFKGFGSTKALATTSISATRAVSLATESSSSSQSSSHIQHSFPVSSTVTRPPTGASSVASLSIAAADGKESDHLTKPIDIKQQAKPIPTALTDNGREAFRSAQEGAVDTDGEEVLGNMLTATEDANTPFVSMLNPSKKTQVAADMTRRRGPWQHVFAKPIRINVMKWKSLCSPACLPLTTEEFPTRVQLTEDYTLDTYEIYDLNTTEMTENEKSGEWLIRELLASRLTRGFSFVVGLKPAEALAFPKAQWYEFLHEKGMSQPGVKVIMSKGAEIHELYNVKSGVVNVSRYVHKSNGTANDSVRTYRPFIKTAYAGEYRRREFSLVYRGAEVDWERLDRFIAGKEEQVNKQYPESINYWRARYILIPIALSGSRKYNHSPEDNEEEIRLEGIRTLTQMWQQNRYISPDERKYTSKLRKDANPLDIVYQTQTASAVISELKDTILADGPDSKPQQLLPEKELFERAKFSMSALARALQGEKGIRMRDRRWHFRLHYNCFVGLELVTWLTNNFRDIDSREEAIEFGNQLMAEGLFLHVEQRHNFRDGNFFYQLREKFATVRQDTKSSWFGRLATQSVPATPLFENMNKEQSPLAATDSEGKEAGSHKEGLPAETKDSTMGSSTTHRASVILSKRLVYDMDHRRKSHRRELVNLHVDRISSADDCYHVRIDWVTATPKLIEDTVESWATLAERYGLRLVEVPLLEAQCFAGSHPFRHHYIIRLSSPPPMQPPQAAALVAASPDLEAIDHVGDETPSRSSISSSRRSPQWPYHKAILKRFDFVLDQEAAKDFPSDVEVRYSWGSPDYQLPQYINRSGRLLAQITEDGSFLFLLNQLYSERGAASREAQRMAAGAAAPAATGHAMVARAALGDGFESDPSNSQGTPVTPGIPGKLSMSPFSSPMVRAATGDSSSHVAPHLPAPINASLFGSDMATSTGSIASPHPTGLQPILSQQPLSYSEMRTIKEFRTDFEAFCGDVEGLQRFYDEELHRPAATVPSTPVVKPLTVFTGNDGTAEEEDVPPELSLKENIRNSSALDIH